MQNILASLAVLGFLSLGSHAIAQTTVNTEPTAPTEVGKTTMPSGQYLMTEISTGKKYLLTVSDKGTMIFGPAPAAAASGAAPTAATSSASGLKGLAEKEMGKGMGSLIEKQGMSQIKNLIK